MLQKRTLSLLALPTLLFALNQAYAQAPNAQQPKGHHEGPCKQLEEACSKNGYFVGGAKEGKGMWWDCMCPLVAMNFPEPSKNVLTVPSDPGLASACRQHPHGQKIMTKCAEMQAKKAQKQAQKQNKNQPQAQSH